MIRWLNKTEMRLAYIVKYGVLVLSLVYLGLATYRYVTTSIFDNTVLFGVLGSAFFLIFFYKYNKLLKLSKGAISLFQVKIMLMYFCRITAAPLFIFCMNNSDVSGMVATALMVCASFVGDFLIRYVDMKKNPLPIKRQESQENEQNEAR